MIHLHVYRAYVTTNTHTHLQAVTGKQVSVSLLHEREAAYSLTLSHL